MTQQFENFVNAALDKSLASDVTLPTADDIPVFTGIGRQVTGKTIVELGIAEVDDLADVATSGSYNDLSDKPTIPAAQVNADWGAGSGVAQILNKPTLGTAAAQNVGYFATAAQGTKADSALQAVSPAITAGTYGSGSNIPIVVVNAAGQVTGISVVALSVGKQTTQNTAFGYDTQLVNTGLYNVSIGAGVHRVLSTGNDNTGVGHSAHFSITTANYNTAVGSHAQINLTTGGDNTAVGALTQAASVITGIRNTTIGSSSQYYLTTGTGNTAAGYESQMNLTTANYNTTIGWRSGRSITTGSNNTIVGSYYGTTSISDNVVLATGGISGGIVVAQHNATDWEMKGALFQNVVVGATKTLTANSQLVVEVTSNTLLTFKLKGTDGTTRTATLALT
jgi:hypothetical protein